MPRYIKIKWKSNEKEKCLKGEKNSMIFAYIGKSCFKLLQISPQKPLKPKGNGTTYFKHKREEPVKILYSMEISFVNS